MRKIDKNNLLYKIKDLLHVEKDIEFLSGGDVIHLLVKGKEFYLYIKSLTYAGNPYPQNRTRAQLPKRIEFDSIKASNSIFLFLGYDVDNNVFACWDPIKTKARLNERQYVSFFCRLNQQKSVRHGVLLEASLQNDFKYVVFTFDDLKNFLLNINTYFPKLDVSSQVISISDKSRGFLLNVEDDAVVMAFIDTMIADGEISNLSLISDCINEFGSTYHKMRLKDWYRVINEYRNKQATFSNRIDTPDMGTFVAESYVSNKFFTDEFVNNGYEPLNDSEEKGNLETLKQYFDYYCGQINKIKQARIYGDIIIAKPILILSIIDGIEFSIFADNEFYISNWLENHYNNLYFQYLTNSRLKKPTSIATPFWHLASDGFWHLHLYVKEQNIRKTPSRAWLIENVQYACFDDALWFLLQNREWRMRLRQYIIEHKLTKQS